MIERAVLIFAYHFPPENVIGSLRPFRFAKYLSRLGYDCRVFTASKQIGYGDARTVYIPEPFTTDSRHTAKWQVERFIRKIFLPGELGVQWSVAASRCARAYLDTHRPAQVTILSSFPPLGVHLAAAQLVRGNKLKWIADYRDPFTDSVKQKQLGRLQFSLRLQMERYFLRRADVVIANTEPATSLLQKRFPEIAAKVHSIWNGFDPEDFVSPLPIPSSRHKVLTHVGELYHGRNVVPILESISRLMDAGHLSSDRTLVRLWGPAEERLLQGSVVARCRAQGWLELRTERVPQKEARLAAQTADALLLIQPNLSVQVPAKLFEYLQVGRPILAFIDKDSPSEYILQHSGVPFRSFYPECAPEEIDKTIKEFFKLSSSPSPLSPWFRKRFNVENQAAELDEIIRRLHGEPSLLETAVRSSTESRDTNNPACSLFDTLVVSDQSINTNHPNLS